MMVHIAAPHGPPARTLGGAAQCIMHMCTPSTPHGLSLMKLSTSGAKGKLQCESDCIDDRQKY